jgi:hypothetical protein
MILDIFVGIAYMTLAGTLILFGTVLWAFYVLYKLLTIKDEGGNE